MRTPRLFPSLLCLMLAATIGVPAEAQRSTGGGKPGKATTADTTPPSIKLPSDLRVEATWFGGDQDLDLALIDPDGNRVSWLGAPTKAVISATDVVSTNREALSLRGAKTGEYVIEIVRSSSAGGPVRGEVTVTVAGNGSTARSTSITDLSGGSPAAACDR